MRSGGGRVGRWRGSAWELAELMTVLMVKAASRAVRGVPSEKTTSWRRVKVQVMPSLEQP